MFEQQGKHGLSLAMPIAICAVGMAVGFGTCGIGVLVGNTRISSVLSGGGIFLFLASGLGLVVLGIIALVRAVMELFRR